jgi:hypothetical protein
MNQLLAGIVRAGVLSSTGRAHAAQHGTERNCADHRQDDSQLPPPPSIDRIDSNCFPWMQGRSKVSRLEQQTTINMSIIYSKKVFTCNYIVYTMIAHQPINLNDYFTNLKLFL